MAGDTDGRKLRSDVGSECGNQTSAGNRCAWMVLWKRHHVRVTLSLEAHSTGHRAASCRSLGHQQQGAQRSCPAASCAVSQACDMRQCTGADAAVTAHGSAGAQACQCLRTQADRTIYFLQRSPPCAAACHFLDPPSSSALFTNPLAPISLGSNSVTCPVLRHFTSPLFRWGTSS